MRKIVSVELRSDGDHYYVRPVFHAGWTHLTGTTRPQGGWDTLPMDPAAALLRHELEDLLGAAVVQIGACWEYELTSPRSRLRSDQHTDPHDDRHDQQHPDGDRNDP